MQAHNFDVDITIPSSKQKIKINKDLIEVNNTSIACKDVKAVKYGVSLIGSQKNPERKEYNIDVQSVDGKEISIKFNSNKVEDLLEEDHTYYYIMSGLWQYVKKHLVSHFIEILNEKQSFEIGNAVVNHEGFVMTYKTSWFFGKIKSELVLWRDIKYYLSKGILHIDSLSDKRKKVSVSLHYDWNAVVLNTLLHYLWQDHRKEKLAKGEKI
ncbi:hypothetical protein [Pedobacter cryophilus]|uniref:Uncharacterized protein n=1 Tax=Pedobacter cryophilus TaxID=2571271 RepID=A0A4U1BU63_9SPHI|nr:hypothetical protein [Pedobacter cryophilus]TKB95143.1 hypothetical protein FA046_16950 [Pedobacter cryophilus]